MNIYSHKIVAHSLLLFFVLFPSLLFSATKTSVNEAIAELCEKNKIVLIGEHHQEPNSQKLFLSLVRHYISQGNNVFVGLEVPADKQKELKKTLSGESDDFSFLYPVIDHAGYRDMVRLLGSIEGKLTVMPIDSRQDSAASRDVEMSRNLQATLSSNSDYDKIVVLVGNNHVIKKIIWHESANSTHKYLAELLKNDGIVPCSVMQSFKHNKDGLPVLVTTDTVRGASLALEVIKYVNHRDTLRGRDICDGVILMSK